MKKFLACTAFLILFVPCIIYSQNKKKVKEEPELPQTLIEVIATTKGKIVKKVYHKIADIRSLEISVLTVTVINDNTKIKGVYLNTHKLATIENTDSYLDVDELDDFIKYIKYLKEILKTKEPLDVTEYIFASKDDFKAFLYNNKGASEYTWRYGVGFSEDRMSNSIEFKEKDIDDFLAAFEMAKDFIGND